MNLFIIFCMCVVCLIMALSFLDFLHEHMSVRAEPLANSQFSLELFYMLIVIYVIVLIGFGLIYFCFSLYEPVLYTFYEDKGSSLFNRLMQSFYFSGVTLLTIGYGDIAPIGIGRIVALIQALLGYVLPTAFVLKLVRRQNE